MNEGHLGKEPQRAKQKNSQKKPPGQYSPAVFIFHIGADNVHIGADSSLSSGRPRDSSTSR